MDYLRGTFSVGAPGSKTYRDNFDKIDWGHGSKVAPKAKKITQKRRPPRRTR